MIEMFPKIPSMVGVRNGDLINSVLDFTAGLTEMDMHEFLDFVPKDVKYFIFVVYHNQKYYRIDAGDPIRIRFNKDDPIPFYDGKMYYYNEGMLIFERNLKEG